MNIEYPILNIQYRIKKSGFSLMEVLIAVGVLALGMLFIASVFPAGLFWTTVASERTISAVAADEAFAKIRLYGMPVLSGAGQNSLSEIYPEDEYAYPSIPTTDPNSKRYWWSAIGRQSDPLDPCSVQVTVFVSRKVGTGTKYYRQGATFAPIPDLTRPIAISVSVSVIPGRPDELQINDNFPSDGINETTFINDGYTIVDDATGQIYRVLERYSTAPNTIRLDKDRQGTITRVWVVPPPVGGGRYPCIAVYPKVIRF